MLNTYKLFLVTTLVCAMPAWAGAQTPRAGDKDDQFVVTGCVTQAADVRRTTPQSLFIWSRGDIYLSSPDARFKPSETARPVGTTGQFFPVFYWLDDEDDFAKYVGQHVEIVGELSSSLNEGQIEFDHKDGVTTIEFEVNGREATARIPSSWLGPATRSREFEANVVVRTVDVEKVTVHGACASR